MSDRPASWRMPTPKQMEKLASKPTASQSLRARRLTRQTICGGVLGFNNPGSKGSDPLRRSHPATPPVGDSAPRPQGYAKPEAFAASLYKIAKAMRADRRAHQPRQPDRRRHYRNV